MESTAGKLLVASPLIGDPNFERSVVLMIEHDENGALGIVLNNVSYTPVSEILPQWAPRACAPDVVFIGGPVSPESVIGLGLKLGGSGVSFRPVVANAGTIDLNQDPAHLPFEFEEIRVFAGYSGWGRQQLEAEIRAEAWFVVEADPRDAFMTEPDELWSLVLGRQRGVMAWLANYPYDPSHN